ncbi:TetR/AcrR family transcriptional regulator C-terminal domain-containing protein [Streptomyces sp. NPDC002514]
MGGPRAPGPILTAAAGAEIFEDYDRRFEEGLELVIAGIEARYGPG